jgi:hypothetical protein
MIATSPHSVLQAWGLNSGPPICEAEALPLGHVPHPSPFDAFSLFFRESLTLLPGSASDCDPPASTSQVAGIIAMHHHAQCVATYVYTHLQCCHKNVGGTERVNVSGVAFNYLKVLRRKVRSLFNLCFIK